MRTPKTPEAGSERTVLPDIQKGEFETKVPEGAFGGVSERNVEAIGQNVDLATRVQDQGEKLANGIVDDKAKIMVGNYLADLNNSADSAQGAQFAQYDPTVKGSQFQNKMGEMVQKVSALANTDEQKGSVQKILDEGLLTAKKTITPKVIKGNFDYASQQSLAAVDASVQQAKIAYDAPADVREALRDDVANQVDKQMTIHGKPLTNADGTPTDEAQIQRAGFQNKFDGLVVAKLQMDQKPQQALDYAKTHLDAKNLDAMMPKLTKAVDEKNATDLFNTRLKYNVDTEGKPETSFMLSKIPKGLTDEQQQTYKNKIISLAGQANQQADERRLNAQDNFRNQIAKMRQSKAPLADQISTADQMGTTPLQKEVFRKYVTDPYVDKSGLTINIGGQNEARKADMNLNMMTNISQGRLTEPVVIDRLFTNGTLDAKEHVAAIKLLNSVNKGGKNAEIASTRDQIQSNAMQVYDDPVKVHAFMQGLDKKSVEGQFTEPKQLMDYAKENLEPESKNPSAFWDKIANNKKTEYQDETAENDPDLMKSLYNDVGREQVGAIFESLNKGNPTPSGTSIKDFDEKFLQKLNVPLSDLGRGKPMNNAMQSIIQWNNAHPNDNIDFTPENITHASVKYPDGYFH